MKRRNPKYHNHITWTKLVMMYGQHCSYCMEEPAQSVDHVVPWSVSQSDNIGNLRPCCLWCNIHAGAKVFDTFEDKQRHLRELRRKSRSTLCRTVCTTCFLPYQRPTMTTSMFECPECDPSKAQSPSQRRQWTLFKTIMTEAGIHVPLHMEIQELSRGGLPFHIAKIELGDRYIRRILKGDNETSLADLNRWHVLDA